MECIGAGSGRQASARRHARDARSAAAGARATSDDGGKLTFQCPLALASQVIVRSAGDRWVLDQKKDSEMQGWSDRRFLGDHECTVDPASALALRVVPACVVSGRLVRPGGQPASFVDVQLEERSGNRMRSG
jgi:hypothetical protein